MIDRKIEKEIEKEKDRQKNRKIDRENYDELAEILFDNQRLCICRPSQLVGKIDGQ